MPPTEPLSSSIPLAFFLLPAFLFPLPLQSTFNLWFASPTKCLSLNKISSDYSLVFLCEENRGKPRGRKTLKRVAFSFPSSCEKPKRRQQTNKNKQTETSNGKKENTHTHIHIHKAKRIINQKKNGEKNAAIFAKCGVEDLQLMRAKEKFLAKINSEYGKWHAPQSSRHPLLTAHLSAWAQLIVLFVLLGGAVKY